MAQMRATRQPCASLWQARPAMRFNAHLVVQQSWALLGQVPCPAAAPVPAQVWPAV